MSRRNAAVKRPVLPDPQFNSRLASMMISRLMKHGKKSTAQRILSDAFSLISERTGGNAVELFETAVKNATPLVEVRARRVGGATYQVPMEVRQERGTAMALRWLVTFSRARNGKSMSQKLAGELWMQQMKLVVQLKKEKTLTKWLKLIKLLRITDIKFVKKVLK